VFAKDQANCKDCNRCNVFQAAPGIVYQQQVNAFPFQSVVIELVALKRCCV
jgi:hypothetical protein